MVHGGHYALSDSHSPHGDMGINRFFVAAEQFRYELAGFL